MVVGIAKFHFVSEDWCRLDVDDDACVAGGEGLPEPSRAYGITGAGLVWRVCIKGYLKTFYRKFSGSLLYGKLREFGTECAAVLTLFIVNTAQFFGIGAVEAALEMSLVARGVGVVAETGAGNDAVF